MADNNGAGVGTGLVAGDLLVALSRSSSFEDFPEVINILLTARARFSGRLFATRCARASDARGTAFVGSDLGIDGSGMFASTRSHKMSKSTLPGIAQANICLRSASWRSSSLFLSREASRSAQAKSLTNFRCRRAATSSLRPGRTNLFAPSSHRAFTRNLPPLDQRVDTDLG